jgi:hypothetical protein
MSIGNGLSFAQAAALAGINPSSILFGAAGGTDTTTDSSVNSLTSSSFRYTPTYVPAPTPAPRTNINQVTGNGFGSSTSSFFTPSNSIFTNTNTNSFSGNLPAVKTPSTVTNTGGGNTVTTPASRDVTKLPPVDKSALLNVSADAAPSGGKVDLGVDPPA